MISEEEDDAPLVIIAHTYVCEHKDGRRDSLIINRIEGDQPPETIDEDGQTYQLERSRAI